MGYPFVPPAPSHHGSLRSPVVVSHLGREAAAWLADHPTRPFVVDAPDPDRPWLLPPEADVLLTRPGPAWGAAPRDRPAGWPGNLRLIQIRSAGIDFFPDWLVTPDGPPVSCGRGLAAAPIAEYALAAILEVEKRLGTLAIRSPDAFRQSTTGTLEGRDLGLYGFGAIGQAVATRARAFGMRVSAVRRTPRSSDREGVRWAPDLAALVAACDHLVLAAPATAETFHALDARVLAGARPGLHVVGVSRGSLVDQDALLAALDDGRVGFASLDVTDPEPLPAGHPLYSHPRVRITPHVSWQSPHYDRRFAERVAANLSAYAAGLLPSDIVDPVTRY